MAHYDKAKMRRRHLDVPWAAVRTGKGSIASEETSVDSQKNTSQTIRDWNTEETWLLPTQVLPVTQATDFTDHKHPHKRLQTLAFEDRIHMCEMSDDRFPMTQQQQEVPQDRCRTKRPVTSTLLVDSMTFKPTARI